MKNITISQAIKAIYLLKFEQWDAAKVRDILEAVAMQGIERSWPTDESSATHRTMRHESSEEFQPAGAAEHHCIPHFTKEIIEADLPDLDGYEWTCDCGKKWVYHEASGACWREPAGTAGERKQGHSALRVKDGKLETFDPNPTAGAAGEWTVEQVVGPITGKDYVGVLFVKTGDRILGSMNHIEAKAVVAAHNAALAAADATVKALRHQLLNQRKQPTTAGEQECGKCEGTGETTSGEDCGSCDGTGAAVEWTAEKLAGIYYAGFVNPDPKEGFKRLAAAINDVLTAERKIGWTEGREHERKCVLAVERERNSADFIDRARDVEQLRSRLATAVEALEGEAKFWDTVVHVDFTDDFMNEYLAKEHANWLREQAAAAKIKG